MPDLDSHQMKENALSGSLGVINVDDSPPGPEFSEGKIQDAQNMKYSEVGASHEGHDIFRECLAEIEDGLGLDASFIFDESRADLTRCEAELKKVSEEMDNLKTLYAKKEEEIIDLRAELAKACQQQIAFTEEFQRKGELVEQLREELKMKEAETLGWRQSMDDLASERETLREQLASLERQFQSVKEERLARGREIKELKVNFAAEMAKAKSDAEAIMSSYRADAEAANSRAKEISTTAEVKLSCALDHARRQSWRETLEEAKTLEEEAASLLSDEDDSASGSETGEDEDEVPEDEALEDATPEYATPK
ncbi:PREDICTED: golgin subfamily A member 6-like protein 4 [Nicotiana attenuata]|uniref:golgin subfamily A member 6-like protein 4 n=1 Tax=Nicotiana attenuata TaxID=49451 RepID=UPI0009046A8F|nr:PREDICTED: golgin subfamily A member 6-like protein 4 [Nicotiana attenuata]